MYVPKFAFSVLKGSSSWLREPTSAYLSVQCSLWWESKCKQAWNLARQLNLEPTTGWHVTWHEASRVAPRAGTPPKRSYVLK